MRQFEKIKKNIKYNAISQVAAFLINFALLPFIVSHAGKEVYGIYILVVTFTGYLGLMDLGVGGATVKYIAEFISRDDDKKVTDIISASFTLFVIIGILAAIALFILSYCFDVFFKVDIASMIIIKHLFWVASVSSLFIWPGRIFDYALQGFQRYDRYAINNIIFTILIGISAYIIFNRNYGIVCFLAASSILTILKYLSSYFIVKKSLLKEKIHFPYFKKDIFKIIFDFSFYTFLSSLAGILIFNLDTIIVGAFVSLAAVTVYNVGFSIQQGFRMLNSLIGGPLFPAYVEMEGKSEYEKQKLVLFKGTKYLGFIFIPMVLVTLIFAKPLIIYWMGDMFVMSVMPAQILISFWLFNGILEIGSGMLSAKGMVKIIFKLLFLNAIINLVLSLILVRFFGIIGVALGTTIPMIFIYFPLIMRQVFMAFRITAGEYFNIAVKKNLSVFLVALAVSIWIYRLYPPTNFWIVIFEMGAAYTITMFAGYGLVFSGNERRELRTIIGFKT